MVAPHFPSLDAAKRAARVAAQARRRAFLAGEALPPWPDGSGAAAAQAAPDPGELAQRLARVILSCLPDPTGRVISGVWPLPGEADLRPALHALAAAGARIALPITTKRGQPLLFRPWRPGEPLRDGPFGTKEPAGGDPVLPDILLVPLLAFDGAGRRLGYGGGYYDRTLAGLPGRVVLGFGFACQQMPQVPAGEADVALPAVATEAGVMEAMRA
jgi:5-formyltetrahydrofolate cyclo-ligase